METLFLTMDDVTKINHPTVHAFEHVIIPPIKRTSSIQYIVSKHDAIQRTKFYCPKKIQDKEIEGETTQIKAADEGHRH